MAIRSDTYVANAAEALQQQTVFDNGRTIKLQQAQLFLSQARDEQSASPMWKRIPFIESDLRDRDRRREVIDRRLDAFSIWARPDGRAIVVATEADERPAVVGALANHIDLVAACGTVLSRPYLCGARVNRHTLWIAMRSEEHTSELQSRENLVCRRLLEKKKRGCR